MMRSWMPSPKRSKSDDQRLLDRFDARIDRYIYWHIGRRDVVFSRKRMDKMTRDEHRDECILTIARAYHAQDCGDDPTAWDYRHVAWEDEPPDYQKWVIALATQLLDSLRGVARVNPIEATEEMIEAGYNAFFTPDKWKAMSARGDLTNPPDTKP